MAGVQVSPGTIVPAWGIHAQSTSGNGVPWHCRYTVAAAAETSSLTDAQCLQLEFQSDQLGASTHNPPVENGVPWHCKYTVAVAEEISIVTATVLDTHPHQLGVYKLQVLCIRSKAGAC
jgi:hypothetical protein